MKEKILKKAKQYEENTAIKFIIVGIINTIIGTTVMYVAYLLFELLKVNNDVNYWISSALNYIIGSIVSYYLNKNFTFKNEEKSLTQIILFVLNILVCYIIAYGGAKELIKILLNGLNAKTIDLIAMFVGIFVFTFLNYFGQKLVVFKNK